MVPTRPDTRGGLPGRDVPADFRAVDWVRTVRDAMYQETHGLSPADFMEYVARKAAAVQLTGSTAPETPPD